MKVEPSFLHRVILAVALPVLFRSFMEHRITAITSQKKNRNRVNIFLDGEYAFSLAGIVAAWLRRDQVIDDGKIEMLLKADSEEKALQKALVYINYRPRSESEVKVTVGKSGF